MSDEHVGFRADSELVKNVEELADSEDISKSEAWRTLARQGLTTVNGDLSHVAWTAEVETIKREEYPNKRAAWFKANVGGRLLTCFNSGLSPDMARKDLNGYLREARELHDSDEFEEYVTEGLAVYDDAYQREKPGLLSTWIKQSNGGTVPDHVPDDAAADETTAAVVDIDPETTYRDAVEMTVSRIEASRDPENPQQSTDPEDYAAPSGFDVTDHDFQEDVTDVLRAQYPGTVDLRGEDDGN